MITYSTIESVFNSILDNSKIVTSMAASEPSLFFEKLSAVSRVPQGMSVYCANPQFPYTCFSRADFEGRVELVVMFLTGHVRNLQGHGTVHYMPQHLSRWSQTLLTEKPVDVFWGSCSTPDSRGFVSLGLGAAYEQEIARVANMVVLEVNNQMPVTSGDTILHISQVHHFLKNDHPLSQLKETDIITPEDLSIGGFVADLVADGSTIQLGIGAIPNAVGRHLRHKKNLGVHTELITDSMKELVECGVITGSKKSLHPSKLIGTFVYGTQALYNFVNGNPQVELYPASYVNDPLIIGRNNKMTSINSAVEIDISGQVVSESVGHRELSGSGGAFDTHTGAQRSAGGRGILALNSKTSKGESKIVFDLKPGAKVTIARNDVDTVVTEFGVALLKNKNTSQRARALISISSPEFRDNLLFQAKKFGYI